VCVCVWYVDCSTFSKRSR